MEIRIPHGSNPDQAAERVRQAAADHDLVVPAEAASDAHSGTLVKETPLGSVRARWQVLDQELVVVVEDRPAFLPEGTVRRALEDGLRGLFDG